MTWNLGAGLEGKGVIVTGGVGGIGHKVAEAFALAGARVMIVDLKQDAVEAAVKALPGEGHLAVGTDLRLVQTHVQLVEHARSTFGSLFVLAHLAAVLRRQYTIADVTEDDWDAQADLNLKASFFLCRAAASAMQAQGQGGRIITFASQGWWTGGMGGSVVYSATKGGIVSMTRGLARTYGPHKITCNAVAPGMVNTSMLTDGMDSIQLEQIQQETPLKRLAEPEEIAGAVIFLASQHASFITGATLNVSGGYLMY